MGSLNFEDYEVLSILGNTTYKMFNKSNGNVFLCKAFSCESSKIEAIAEQIDKQIEAQQTHMLMEICDYIIKEDSGVIYVFTEYLTNGNLNSIVQKCVNENKYINEHFLWKTLYQISSILKCFKGIFIDLNNVFVDDNFNLKVFKEISKEKQKTNFAHIIQSLCSLQLQKTNADILNYYTNELKEIVKFISSPIYSSKEVVDTILCHPTILSKAAKATQIYVEDPELREAAETEILHDAEDSKRYVGDSIFTIRP